MRKNQRVRQLQGCGLSVIAVTMLMTSCTFAEPAGPSMNEQLRDLPIPEMCSEVVEAINNGEASEANTNTITVGEGVILLDHCLSNLPLSPAGDNLFDQLLSGTTIAAYKVQTSAAASIARACEAVSIMTDPIATDCSKYTNNHYVVVLGED